MSPHSPHLSNWRSSNYGNLGLISMREKHSSTACVWPKETFSLTRICWICRYNDCGYLSSYFRFSTWLRSFDTSLTWGKLVRVNWEWKTVHQHSAVNQRRLCRDVSCDNQCLFFTVCVLIFHSFTISSSRSFWSNQSLPAKISANVGIEVSLQTVSVDVIFFCISLWQNNYLTWNRTRVVHFSKICLQQFLAI